MNEEFRDRIEIIESAPDRKVKQVTHRNLESYLNTFNLPDAQLAQGGTVVDVGAGFSSFSEEARGKYEGLRAIAVDPVYKLLKDKPNITPLQFETEERVTLDFQPIYRGGENISDLDQYQKEQAEFFNHFVNEQQTHPDDYIDASHQDIPLETGSADLVLASNSIIRSKNKPEVIQNALGECFRILKDHGEIRIAGSLACFICNDTTGSLELWYNGTLVPNGPWVKEFKQTGHYSDPELMKVFAFLEGLGAKFYGIFLSGKNQYGNSSTRFDTLIIRTDENTPVVAERHDPKEVQVELRKLEFQANDGFNIPTTIVKPTVAKK